MQKIQMLIIILLFLGYNSMHGKIQKFPDQGISIDISSEWEIAPDELYKGLKELTNTNQKLIKAYVNSDLYLKGDYIAGWTPYIFIMEYKSNESKNVNSNSDKLHNLLKKWIESPSGSPDVKVKFDSSYIDFDNNIITIHHHEIYNRERYNFITKILVTRFSEIVIQSSVLDGLKESFHTNVQTILESARILENSKMRPHDYMGFFEAWWFCLTNNIKDTGKTAKFNSIAFAIPVLLIIIYIAYSGIVYLLTPIKRKIH